MEKKYKFTVDDRYEGEWKLSVKNEKWADWINKHDVSATTNPNEWEIIVGVNENDTSSVRSSSPRLAYLYDGTSGLCSTVNILQEPGCPDCFDYVRTRLIPQKGVGSNNNITILEIVIGNNAVCRNRLLNEMVYIGTGILENAVLSTSIERVPIAEGVTEDAVVVKAKNIAANMTNSEVSGTVEVMISNHTCQTYTITQDYLCDCVPIVNDFIEYYDIPQSGTSSGTVLFKFYIQSGYPEKCRRSISAIMKNSTSEGYAPNLDFVFSSDIESGIVAVSGISVSEISSNETETPRIAYYSLNVADKSCYDLEIFQEGLNPCTCDDIQGVPYGGMITPVETNFSLDGSDGVVIFASGSTNGCGELSGSVQESNMVEDFRIESEYVYDQGVVINKKYYFKGKVPSFNESRDTSLYFYFLDRHGNLLQCGQAMGMHQGNDSCSCPHFTGMDMTITATDGNKHIDNCVELMRWPNIALSRHEDFTLSQFVMADAIVENGIEWCSAYTMHTYSDELVLCVKCERNNTGANREARIKLKNVCVASSNVKIHDNSYYYKTNFIGKPDDEVTICEDAGEIKFIQPLGDICTCENNGFSFSYYPTRIYPEDSIFSIAYNKLSCGNVIAVTAVELYPTIEEAGEWVTVNDFFDGYALIEVDSNGTKNDRYFKIRVVVEVDNGITCEYTTNTIYQNECYCGHLYSEISFETITASHNETHKTNLFKLKCGTKASDYEITPMEDYSWIIDVSIKDGDSGYAIIEYEFQQNDGEERIAYFKITCLNEDFNDCEYDISLKQTGYVNVCADCNILKSCVNYAYYNYIHGDDTSERVIAIIDENCQCSDSVFSIASETSEWLSVYTTHNGKSLCAKANSQNYGDERYDIVDLCILGGEEASGLTSCCFRVLVSQGGSGSSPTCECIEDYGITICADTTTKGSDDYVIISTANTQSNQLYVGEVRFVEDLPYCLYLDAYNAHSSYLMTRVEEVSRQIFKIWAYIVNSSTTENTGASTIKIKNSLNNDKDCDGTSKEIYYIIQENN